MIIIRPIQRDDQNIFAELSYDAILGMTNFPRDREKFQEKIEHSIQSFQKEVTQADHEEYLFVLQDLTTGRIGGTAGILSEPSATEKYFYRIENVNTGSHHTFTPKQLRILKIASSPNTRSEICSLYLQPTFRHSGLGRLLSLSRFQFMAAFPQRFHKKIMAVLRGYIDQKQISPFWDAVGRHFCELSFVELMSQLDQDRTFIEEILPKYPLYLDLLSKEAQEVIGKTHDNTKPAYHMLKQEGFEFQDEIDLFEGGPRLLANLTDIRSIRTSKLIKIETTQELLKEEGEYILSNNKIDFRACYGYLDFLTKNTGAINQDIAEALKVKSGDTIRYVPLH